MNEQVRSEQACPVCARHTLAVDEPPHIDVMGVQPYSDIVGMGDLPAAGGLGILCLSCDTHWRDKAAFDRGEPDPTPEPDLAEPATAPEPDAEADGTSGGGGAE